MRQPHVAEKARVRRLERQNADKDKHLSARKLYRQSLPGKVTDLWLGAKVRARNHGCDFTLTKEWIKAKLEHGKCAVTGWSFSFDAASRVGHFYPRAPSLDRLESSKGYTPDNVRIVCAMVNMAKHEWSHETFVEMCKAVVAHERQSAAKPRKGKVQRPSRKGVASSDAKRMAPHKGDDMVQSAL